MSRMRSFVKRMSSVLLIAGICFQMHPVQLQAAEPERVLIWSDEFDALEIDSEKWTATDQIYMENGCAVLPASYQEESGEWSQSWLTTQGRFGFQYGRLEARIKMTAYPGEFPAFWTMGYNKQSKNTDSDIDGCRWSKCGEIDIMEEYSPNGNIAEPGAALHWCNNWLERNQSKSIGRLTGMNTTQWHIYAMEWDENGIEIFYDDVSVGVIDYNELDYYNNMNPFEMPQYILFDNLINDPKIADTKLTSKMWIDWVRVYSPEDEISVVKETGITLEEVGTRKAIQSGKMAVGDSAYINVRFIPENVVNQSYQLISANENIIKVNGGVLTAVAPGETEVVAVSPNGKMDAWQIEVFYDDKKDDLSAIQLESADSYLLKQKAWYWGENARSLDTNAQKIHSGLIKVSPNTTYEIAVTNQCMGTKINIIEYTKDGSYIKWADYKDGILKTGKDAGYVRINMTLSKSGITMNYGDYLEYLKYSNFVINKKG